MKITNMMKVAVLMALFTVSGMSHALMISVFDGTTTVSVSDGGSGDLAGATGTMVVTGSVGSWSYLVTAVSVSTSLFADLYETSIDTSSSGGGILTVTVSDAYTGLGTTGTGTATANITPSAVAGSILFTSDLNSGTTIVHSDTLTSVTTSAGSSGFAKTDPLTVTQTAVISHSGAGTTSFDATTHVNVPEPVSLALLGIGLIGLGLARKRDAK